MEQRKMRETDWQDGFPPCNGIWKVELNNYSEGYARFHNGVWGWLAGENIYRKYMRGRLANCKLSIFSIEGAYRSNQNKQWKGLIDE